MQPEVKKYLHEVRSHLHLDPATEKQIIRELYSYFEEKVGELRESGLSQKEAVDLAIKCCGRPRAIALRMYEAHSKGSWIEAALACLPHLLLAGLFFSHLWTHPLSVLTTFSLIVFVTLCGWWHGKPSWMYKWVGCSLLLFLLGGYFCQHTLSQAVSFLLWRQGTPPSIWTLLAMLFLIIPSFWIVTRTAVRVVRRDWILASLMLVPVPIVVGWFLNLVNVGSLFTGNTDKLHMFDPPMALSLVTLGVTSAAFIRLRQRLFKIGALIIVGTIALSTVVHTLWGDQGFLGLLVTTGLLLATLLSPALLEAKLGHGERGEVWWEGSGV